jgi:integrase
MAGSVRQRGPNRWQVRVSAGRDPATNRYRYVTRSIEGGKRDALRAATELETEVRHGMRPAERGTVADLLEKWMLHLETQGRAPSTLIRYRSAIDVRIVPALGWIEVTKLTAADLDTFYGALIRQGFHPLSVRKCHAVLSAALHQAEKWGWIDRNPIVRASPPPARQREIIPPTIDEVRQLIVECERLNPDLARLFTVAATTGCRRGELCGLQWGDIDFERATMVVARSISDTPGRVEVKDTKTHAARRIALDPLTVEVLRLQRTVCDERATAAGVAIGTTGFIWSQEVDASKPYRPIRVSGTFRTVRDKLELKNVTFHGLRHFSATALAGQGVGIRTIAGRLGHANPNLTLRTYAHFLEVADREAADAMGELAAGFSTGSGPARTELLPPKQGRSVG